MKLINKIKCFFKGHVKHSGEPAAISLAWGHHENQVTVNVDWCVRCATLFGWEQPVPVVDVGQRTVSYGNIPKLSDLLNQEKYNIPSSFDMDFLINNVIVKLNVKRATQEENSDLGPHDFNIKNVQGKISKWTIANGQQAGDTYNEICHTLGAISDPVEVTLRDHLFDQLDFFRPNGGQSIGKVGQASYYITNPGYGLRNSNWTDVTFKVEPIDEKSDTSTAIPGQEKSS